MKPVLNTLLVTLAGLSMAGGLICTIWTYDWRYTGTGFIIALLVAIIAGSLTVRKTSKDQR